MDERTALSRRRLLHTLAASGVIAAADLAWWDEPLICAEAGWGAEPVRFQWSVPEPTRIALMNSLAERFNASQKDFAVQIEYVPQAQARQKLISSITGGNPPDLCQAWDNWIGQFNGMGAVEDITARAKAWKHYADVAPTAWQTVTINDKIISLPLAVTLDGIYYRTDRVKELGLKAPTPDWTWDDFLALAKAFTKADKNQYGFGMRGSGTWALLYPSEFCYANGAEVLKDGKVVINSKEAVDALVLVSRPRAQAQGHAAVGRHRRLCRDRRGLRPRRHQHVPAQFRLQRPAEEECRRREFRHRSAADRACQEARLVLVLRDAHHVQGRQEQGGRLGLHELHARGRAEPEIQSDARPVAGAQVDPRPAGIRQRSGACRFRAILPVSASSARTSPIPAGAARSTPTACR